LTKDIKPVPEEIMAYKYRAYTPDKKIIQGRLEATSENMAEAALYQAGYQRILSLREVSPGPSLDTLIPTLFGIKTRDVIDFSQQLATLFESGLPILTALKLLEGQASKVAMKRIISVLAEDIGDGNPLSQALSKYPQVFSSTYCQVIKASEQTGKLEVGLRQMATYLEKQTATKQKVTHAMIYPAMVLAVAIGVVALLVTVALPPLAELFASLGAELPITTRLLMAGANFAINYKFYLLGGLLILITAAFSYARLPAGRLNLDKLLLKLPIFGTINLERHMQQFCQMTSMLLKTGVRLPQIIGLATQTISNRIIRQALTDVTDKLVQGEGLSQPMAANPIFPPLLVEMIVMGEHTGTMDDTLATLADYYQKRVDQQVGVLTSLLEPLVTVFIGLVVIFIALSMITPLYSILRTM
jgi:type IV pilus assembly protein PilC